MGSRMTRIEKREWLVKFRKLITPEDELMRQFCVKFDSTRRTFNFIMWLIDGKKRIKWQKKL